MRRDGEGADRTAKIDAVVAELGQRVAALPPGLAHHAAFAQTYRRTTAAVGAAVAEGRFEDPEWVARWDVVFARLYVDALDAQLSGRPVPRPWRLAFEAPADLPALRHVLLGINAHINYDLPQALLRVVSPGDFADPDLLDRRRRDHERIDGVLAGRVAAEDQELGPGSLLDRLLTPLNRLGSRRFLAEARRKVWHNTFELHAARLAGPEEYGVRLTELEVLAAAKIADILAPGQVVLRLTVAGFGITLPPAAG